MPVCTGGSEKQPDAPDFVHIDPTYLASFLPPAIAWLAPYVPYIAPLQLDVNEFCSTDPPALPTIDAQDVWSIISRDRVGIAIDVAAKFTQLLKYIAWYRFCQCSIGTTPPIGTLPSDPGGLPEINPPDYVSGPAVTPCLALETTHVDYSPNNSLHTGYLRPAGRNVTLFRWTVRVQVITPPGPSVTVIYKELDETNGSITTFQKTTVLGHIDGFQFTAQPYPNTTAIGTDVLMDGTAGLTRVWTVLEAFCDGQAPGGTISPCCPPDNVLQGQIASILETVTLLQRQLAPFATVDKAAHSLLTGAGEIEIQGLVAIRVDIIVLPDSYGVRFADPDQHFDLGWISWGDPNGWHTPERVIADPHRSAPTFAAACTRIGYFFNPGITATIVEMAREP